MAAWEELSNVQGRSTLLRTYSAPPGASTAEPKRWLRAKTLGIGSDNASVGVATQLTVLHSLTDSTAMLLGVVEGHNHDEEGNLLPLEGAQGQYLAHCGRLGLLCLEMLDWEKINNVMLLRELRP